MEQVTGNRTCVIVGAGSFQGMTIRPQRGDLVIAADGGFDHLQKEGICPDVLMGDFDSIERQPEHEHLIRFSPIKDDTDMALAAAYGSEQGCDTFLIYGGLGGRLDHTLANLQMMTGLSRQGKAVYLIGEGVILTAVTSEIVSFDESCHGMISVFCMGEPASGVTERGLKYSLEDGTLTCDRALGVSNEFAGSCSSIEVKEGTLVILWDEANGLPRRRPL